MTKFLGDVHGRMSETIGHPDAIQVGDYGIGFATPLTSMKYIRGNHDNPALCLADPNYLGEFGVYKAADREWFFVSGGFSIDRWQRRPGIDWWEDEELSYSQLDKAISLYAELKPDYVFSHEAPADISNILLTNAGARNYKPSRTAWALQTMLTIHSPKIWIHGHLHISADWIFDGTRFVCLVEVEVKEI